MSTTIVNKLDEVLKSNFDDILAEFNNAKNDIDFLPYRDGRQEGEWNVFGLKSIWGHWSKTSKIKFPTIRNIFENHILVMAMNKPTVKAKIDVQRMVISNPFTL